jgi:uncharacterized membrane protein
MGTYARVVKFQSRRSRKKNDDLDCTPLQKLSLTFFLIQKGDNSQALTLLPVSEYPLLSKLLQSCALKQLGNNDYKSILETIDEYISNVDTDVMIL